MSIFTSEAGNFFFNMHLPLLSWIWIVLFGGCLMCLSFPAASVLLQGICWLRLFHFHCDSLMALTANKVASSPIVTKGIATCGTHKISYPFGKAGHRSRLHSTDQGLELWQVEKVSFSKSLGFNASRKHSPVCFSTGSQNTKSKGRVKPYGDCSEVSRYWRPILIFEFGFESIWLNGVTDYSNS